MRNVGARRIIDELNEEHREHELRPLKKLIIITHKLGIGLDCYRFGEPDSSLLWYHDGAWRIVLNINEPPPRRTFSLGHELGHWLLHRGIAPVHYFAAKGSDPTMEREANAVAGALLMPEEMILRLHRGMSLEEIASLLRLSQQAVCVRLRKLGAIP